MISLNLAEYIRQGMIFKNLEANDLFDAVVYEQYDNAKVIPPANFHVCTHHGSQLVSELLVYHHAFDRLLVVVDQTPISALLPFFEQLDPKKKVIVVNIGSGVSGFVNKGKAEVNDVSLLHALHISQGEPFDFVSFFTFLESDHSMYIRLSLKEFGGNIFKSEEANMATGYIDLRKYGIKGKDGTVVVLGALVSETIQVIQNIDANYDWFIQTHLFKPLSEELIESLESTQRLLFVGDIEQRDIIENRRWATLKKHGLGHVSVTFICAKSELVQGAIVDVIYEQAELSLEKLAERFTNVAR